ncbi:MAG TPA: hypothetical protein VFV38_49985 [Ktedonobacteraceae bacterium]|nr:hypothetical protein [Ktedonobacteraceae bacterium]
MEKRYLTTLAHEFRAGGGSFLLQLRTEMHWDKDAFRRLTEAMRACCEDYQHSPEQRERFCQGHEPLTEEQMTDEQFADEYYPHSLGNDTLLPRWLAEGFWSLSTFVREHTAWANTIAREPAYFAHAYERLDDFASWLFRGERPWLEEDKGGAGRAYKPSP